MVIEDQDVKIAENPDEALLESSIKHIEDKLRAGKLQIEIDKVTLDYLLKKRS